MRTLIENGLVIDPKHHVESRLHVVLDRGKVEALLPHRPEGDFLRIDAAGKVVCPGFLDIHMHEAPICDLADVDSSIFGCMLRMGVTTVLAGNCGENILTPLEYFPLVEASGLPVNLCMMAGHGSAREAVGCRDKYASLSDADIEKVARELGRWLDAGCFGISYGIRYYPGIDRRELFATAKLCQKDHLLVSTHVRDDAAYIIPSIEELLAVGRAYDLKIQVSHLGSMGGYGQMAEVLSMLDGARCAGLDVMSDCYPYSAFCTQIGEATYDPGFLDRYHCGYDAIRIASGPHCGERCTESLFRTLRETAPDTITVAAVMRPEDVRLAMAHPAVMLCSDGLMEQGQGHPRAAGTFPRLYSEYVRKGDLTLTQAVEKMTSLPAERLGLDRKGTLFPGSDGDVVIFDPETIRDTATFEMPNLPPEGIDYVIMDGEIVCDHGVIQKRNGKILKRI